MDTAQDAHHPHPRWRADGRSPQRSGRFVPAVMIPMGVMLAGLAVLTCPPAWANPASESSNAIIAPAGPVSGEAGSPETSIWARSFYKMLTYETIANASDVVILSALSGGIGSVGAGFLGANVATAATVYYAHEVAWAALGTPPEDHTALVTGAKATTYRFVSVSRSFGLAYFLAGSTDIATSFALIGNIADTIIYIGNEWAWNVLAPPARGATEQP